MTPSRSARPRLALTPGDPGGVGPEIVARVREDPVLAGAAEWIVVDRATRGPHPARPTAEGGRASLEAFLEAIELAARGEVDGVVTGPVDKRSLRLAGSPHPGHTAILRERTAGGDIRMMMVAPEALRVVLVTDHLPLAEVPAAVTDKSVLATLRIADRALRQEFGIPGSPALALLGLNPHAGDDGVLGGEELASIAPAARLAREAGIAVRGPFPADGFFASRADRDYDCVVSTYHDQGLIPVKLLGGWRTVGVTIGLPFVRTSVGHGTAFDRVGRADPSSMIEAVRLAAWLVAKRRAPDENRTSPRN